MLTLLTAALLHLTDVTLDDEEPLHHELTFLVDGGLSAGLPVAAWAGGAVRYEYRFDSGLFLGVLGGLSLGLGMLDPRASFLAGAHFVDTRHFTWTAMLYSGWPLLGVATALEVFPLRLQHFEGSFGLRGSGELLWNAEGDAFVKLAVPVRGWAPSVRVAVEAGLGARSGAHVGPTLAVQLARSW